MNSFLYTTNSKNNTGASSASHCITDQPFWEEVLKPKSGHCLSNPLAVLLPVLEGYAADHNSKNANAAKKDTSKREEKGGAATNKNRKANDGPDADHEPFGDDAAGVGNTNNAPDSNKNGGASSSPTSSSPSHPFPDYLGFEGLRESPMSLTLLQHVLMYAVPMDQMRYVVPAMSSSWNSTAVVEKQTNRVVTHGSVAPPAVTSKVQYKSVVCGDTFISLLTSSNEVHVAGQLESPPPLPGGGNSSVSSADPQALRAMTSNKVKMLSGHGSKLMALTTAHTIRPLSVIPANTKTLIPYRLCKFLECGLGDDCYMVGFDNILYKTTASQRALGTPRRVMTMSKVGISRVAAGAGFLVMIDLCGRIYTMGKNKRGQLGNGRKQDSMRKPFQHSHLQHHYFINAAVGDLHSIVLASNGVAYATGCNTHGQLGLGRDVPEVLTFTRVPLPAKCTSIACGPSTSMFACADGKVYVCGFNELGMLGVEGVNRADRIIYRPTPLSGIERGAVEMVLDNFSLAPSAIVTPNIGVGGGVSNNKNGPGGGSARGSGSGNSLSATSSSKPLIHPSFISGNAAGGGHGVGGGPINAPIKNPHQGYPGEPQGVPSNTHRGGPMGSGQGRGDGKANGGCCCNVM